MKQSVKQAILFIVINGAGLGHLTRTLAVARRLRNITSDFEVVFYTTSFAYKLVENLGFRCYHTPDLEQMPGESLVRDWEMLILRQLERILKLHYPKIAVFDGAYPMMAILKPLEEAGGIRKIWLKREGDRPNMLAFHVYEKYFDDILIPKEVGLVYKETNHKDTNSNKQYLSPIMYIDKSESYSRQQVRENFGLKDSDYLWYVQLGNEGSYVNKSEIDFILHQLLKDKRNVVFFGESIVNSSIVNSFYEVKHERMIKLRNYPNSMYFEGIDFAVSAAGYNTFHELLAFKVPAIYLPNKRVVKDDQVARAKRAESLGVGLTLKNREDFIDAVLSLEQNAEEYRRNFEKIQFKNGAMLAAEYMNNLYRDILR